MTSAARERHARRRKNPKARQRNILGSTRGSRVGFGGSPKQFFIPEKFAKAGRFRQHAGRVRSPIQDRTQPKYGFQFLPVAPANSGSSVLRAIPDSAH